MILLLGPFVVAFVSRVFLKQPLPRCTVPALIVSTGGAFLGLFGDLLETTQEEGLDLVFDDYIGFMLAFVGVFGTAFYYLFLQQIKKGTSTDCVVWLSFLICTLAIPMSVPLEDWTVWADFTWIDYFMWVCYSVFVLLTCQYMQMAAIRKLGAPLVTTLQPVRMVSALAYGLSPLLGEELSTLNIIGAVIIMISLGSFLFLQFWTTRKKDNDTDTTTTTAKLKEDEETGTKPDENQNGIKQEQQMENPVK